MSELRRRLTGIALVALALTATGVALEPLAAEASRAARPPGAAALRNSAGEGLMLASLGGLRTLVADAFRLRAYLMWERRDRAACLAYADLACTLSPETPAFRETLCTWLAFDMPHWAVAEAGGRKRLGPEGEAAIHRRDAAAVLKRLAREQADDPDEPRYPLLEGQIRDIKLHDEDGASDAYRRAAETPAAPWYPAWLHAEKLMRTARPAEAAAFMRRFAARAANESDRRDALDYAAHAEKSAAGR